MKVINTQEEEEAWHSAHATQVRALDFFATWCGPCVKLGPAFEALPTNFVIEKGEPRVVFAKVDVDGDDGDELMEKYGVVKLPTFVLIVPGQEPVKFVGEEGFSTFRAKLETMEEFTMDADF